MTGTLAAELIDVQECLLPDDNTALNAFASALGRTFPLLDLPQSKFCLAFDGLCTLARASRNPTFAEETIRNSSKVPHAPRFLGRKVFPVHVRSDRNDSNELALEIDASPFSGGSTPFPESEGWNGIIAPLGATERWLKSRQVSRVALSGSFRLTTAFVRWGWTLRSTNGFELEISTRSGVWATDDRPDANEHEWQLLPRKRWRQGGLRSP